MVGVCEKAIFLGLLLQLECLHLGASCLYSYHNHGHCFESYMLKHQYHAITYSALLSLSLQGANEVGPRLVNGKVAMSSATTAPTQQAPWLGLKYSKRRLITMLFVIQLVSNNECTATHLLLFPTRCPVDV